MHQRAAYSCPNEIYRILSLQLTNFVIVFIMRFQSSVSVVAVPLALGAAASADTIGALDNAVSASLHINSPSKIINDNATPKRRLLQRFQKRKQYRNKQIDGPAVPDVGILSTKSKYPRFLQSTSTATGTTEEDLFYCPRSSCPEPLCDCADEGGSIELCSSELQSVCLNGQLGDCVFNGFLEIYKTIYCPLTFCLNDGFDESKCDCAFYEMYCSHISSGNEDCELFGCDETSLATSCEQAKSCKESGDLNDLPLTEWTMRMNNGAVERGGSGVVMAALGILSAFCLLE